MPGPGNVLSPYPQGWVPERKESHLERPCKKLYVGIDVCKAALDVAILPARVHFVVGNDEAGIDELLGKLLAELSGEALVVLESSGGFERPVAAALAASEIALFVVNARQARDLAKATGKLAKTDRIDAAVLAHFAEAVRPEPRPRTLGRGAQEAPDPSHDDRRG